jgi:hypothetical protein
MGVPAGTDGRGVVVLRPIGVAAFLTGRRASLIRRWYLAGALTTAACDVQTRAVLVDVVEVGQVADRRQWRPRRVA